MHNIDAVREATRTLLDLQAVRHRVSIYTPLDFHLVQCTQKSTPYGLASGAVLYGCAFLVLLAI